MINRSILVVEDEEDLANLISYNLEREGYSCSIARDGKSALAQVRKTPPDLIVLDRMLPVMSGDDFLKEIRHNPETASLPVIMLTAKTEEVDQLVGFALGADDYVTKPCSMKLLSARVAAMLRRKETPDQEQDVLTAGPIRLDITRYELTVDDKPVTLTATEFKILQALMTVHGRVLNREHLIETVMGPTVAVTDRTIDVHVTSLRKKLGTASGWLQTVRGIGYTFRPPV